MDQSIFVAETVQNTLSNEINTNRLSANIPFLVVICGATATGKSSLALSLAQRLNSVILGADSRQVYREFSIGTAKPTPQEQNLVPHALIDICEPTETLTVAEYQQQAQGIIHQATVCPDSQPALSPFLLVGGTGLYIKSIVRGMQIPRVAPQLALRSQLSVLGQGQAYQMLQQVDSQAADRIHLHDHVRTLRALEIFYVTGRPMSQQQGEQPPTYPIVQIGLDSDRLSERIQARTAQMFELGLEAEVRNLCAKYGQDLPLLNTLGYREMRQYLRGEISRSQAEHLIGLHTRQLAKRQRTWFRADSTIHWFDSDRPDLLDQVWQQLHQKR